MKPSIPMVEIWRGGFLESLHSGHAVICDAAGNLEHVWGNPETVILPRSSTKIIQALPLVESGAAKGLGPDLLALACASHNGAQIHTDRVANWLTGLGLTDANLRCGPQAPRDREAKHAMIRAEGRPCQIHNNCSGKHAGFLTLSKHLRAGPEYVDPTHPVQQAVRAAFEDVTGLNSPGFGIDGCSAPNFATTLHGLARAMAFFAAARTGASDGREKAAARLVQAMLIHPEMVAGSGGTDTELMRAANGHAVIKTGAEGVYVAILPAQGLGVALKITDGATRASECAIAALLVRLGVLDARDPRVEQRLSPIIRNFRGIATGRMQPAANFSA